MDTKGKRENIVYYPHTSRMVWQETGYPIQLANVGLEYFPRKYQVWNPDVREKWRDIETLKVNVGLGCNLGCTYCSQKTQLADYVNGNPQAAMRFLTKLPTFFKGGKTGDGEGTRIEFWGGEPFMYFKAALRTIGSAMRSAYPKARMNIVTNGTLLTDEIIEWIIATDISIAISHDGPGYKKNRDKYDPLEDPEQVKQIRKLYDALREKEYIGFNCVLTRQNPSLNAVRYYIATKLNVPVQYLPVTTEEALIPYDEGGLSLSPQNEAEQRMMMETAFWEAVTGNTTQSQTVREKQDDFFQSLRTQRPSNSFGQKCGMDDPRKIAVDLDGNVLTCQNTSGKNSFNIGHVDKFDEINLHTLHNWQHREECVKCPVVQLCKGACFFIEDKLWAQGCDNSFHYNVAMLGAVLHRLTGKLLVNIEAMGNDYIRRPGQKSFKVFEVENAQA